MTFTEGAAMKKMNKLAFAVCAGLAAFGSFGCASNQVAELSGPDAAQPPAAERTVIRALPSYGSMGGYRYRRFAAVSTAS
jgi:hypothetical protein